MSILEKKHDQFDRRRARVRAKIAGSGERPRLSIFKSHRYIYAQIVDDEKGHTLAASDSRSVKGATPVDRAREVGKDIASKAKTAKVSKVVFDRSGYLYAGKIKVVADAAREGGLIF